MNSDIRKLLEGVKEGTVDVDDALLKLKVKPFEDIGYAKVDLHRRIRQGAPEVIYGAGKTPEQILGIMKTMCEGGEDRILITRLTSDSAAILRQSYPIAYYPEARIGILGDLPSPDGLGTIVIATGGTSDIPVAEEAALTATYLGNQVARLYDVGVAGLHRLLSHTEDIMNATQTIAITSFLSTFILSLRYLFVVGCGIGDGIVHVVVLVFSEPSAETHLLIL